MKTNKILLLINNLNDINKYKELGINNFVYPLKDYTVGIPDTFLYEEIKEDGYLYINRILDNKSIDELNILFHKENKHIKGIIFDDLGIFEIIKDLDIEKILYLSHFNNNSESVKIFLSMVNYVMLSTDITIDEIKEIRKYNSNIILYSFGYVSAMYSRRLLIDNYSKYYGIEYENPIIIENNNHKFMLYENNYGTIFYDYPLFNGLELMNIDACYYFINTIFLKYDDIKNVLNNNYDYLETNKGFLYKKTIYKLKEDNHD